MFVLKRYRSSWSGFRSTNRYEYGALVALISLYSKSPTVCTSVEQTLQIVLHRMDF